MQREELDIYFLIESFEDYEFEFDDRILDDSSLEQYDTVPRINFKFSVPSITKLIKRSGVVDENGIPKGISNSAAEYLSSIANARLKTVMYNALTLLDERGAKVLVPADIINALDIMGETIISPHQK